MFRINDRFTLGSLLALGLCAAMTLPARTTSAKDGSTSSGGAGGGSGAAGGRSTGGTSTVAPPAGIDPGLERPTWREVEIVLMVDPSFVAMPHAEQALEGALLAWTSMADQLPKVTLRYTQEAMADQSVEENRGDHRIFFVPSGDERAKGALAITLVTVEEGKNAILDADILVNGGHLFTDVVASDGGQSPARTYDLQNVIAHEFGHWFGLGEDYVNTEATMYAYVYPGEIKKRDLTQSDVTAAQLAYWQADNPSENVGCSLTRTPSRGAPWELGCLAVAICLLQRRNRPATAHLLARYRRLLA